MYRFDFTNIKDKIIIELDGRQHFIKVERWNSNPDDIRATDVYKMKRAIKKGYTVIRILQTDVYHDRNDWKNKLNTTVQKAIKSNKFRAIYIGGQIYDKHKEDMK